MKIEEVLEHLRERLLVNVSNYKFTNNADLVPFINDVIAELWSEFNLEEEQAIIAIPDNNTKLFTLATLNDSYDTSLKDVKRLKSADNNVILGYVFQNFRKLANSDTENKIITELIRNKGFV